MCALCLPCALGFIKTNRKSHRLQSESKRHDSQTFRGTLHLRNGSSQGSMATSPFSSSSWQNPQGNNTWLPDMLVHYWNAKFDGSQFRAVQPKPQITEGFVVHESVVELNQFSVRSLTFLQTPPTISAGEGKTVTWEVLRQGYPWAPDESPDLPWNVLCPLQLCAV